ncbi:hypothetical protein BIU97_06705 [Curtobacterium sp. MCBA15_009]|uniref:JmjC domain-containing protein n=1 Tax=Curtobacterium sp. MCBA15_009 TaxID=1898737 RepID=UPI0008DD857A|nr:cupin domain-containing protein [Curtobacterium sp. MCBA15_009]OII11565.1 hypothetical protein BIU97_06705 [Curtobacterium sp. MCBA15_009]
MTLWGEVQAALGGASVRFGELVLGRIDGRAVDRVGWRAVDRAMAQSTFEHGLIKVVPAVDIDQTTLVETRIGAGDIVERRPRRKPFIALLRDGATLVVNKAERVVPELRDVVECLEYAMHEAAWVNGYSCWASESAFGRHSDSHDTVILQAEGEKHWRVHRGGGAADEVALDAVLRPGDVMHVPIGWDHEVTGVGGETLHWTFGVVRTSPTEAIREILQLGVPLHDITTDDDDRLRRELFIARSERSPERRRGLSLPWSVRDDDLSGASFRWAARFPPTFESAGDRVSLRSLGKSVKVASEFTAVIEAWVSGGRVAHAQIHEMVQLSTDDVDRTLRALLRADLLLADHDDR